MKKDYKRKLLWLTIFHRVVMLIAALIYIDLIAFITTNYGTWIGALTLNFINMFIYYLYNYVFLKLLKIQKD